MDAAAASSGRHDARGGDQGHPQHLSAQPRASPEEIAEALQNSTVKIQGFFDQQCFPQGVECTKLGIWD